MPTRSRSVAVLTVVLGGVVAALAAVPAHAARPPRVLRVGSWHGIRGTYPSIQAAVDAARPGDWVLVGPGDWKERGDRTTHRPAKGKPGDAVTVDVPGIHLRGMDRNRVVVDGTRPGTPRCSSRRADQDFGTTPAGRNGIVVYADRVWVENLTACNFLGEGNQIWWNGGDASGKMGMGPYWGNYLSATTTYYRAKDPQATYGIFVSNARGPGSITDTYASNMNDASYYIGACADCNAVLNRAWAENSALGYSGTNSGGHLVIENSEWDDNASGIVTNSQNNDDAPSPQDGSCPHGGTGPTGTTSCEIWRNNYVHDNNNPNVPQSSGAAGAGPVGTGMVVAGGRFDTIVHNRIVGNKAWGILTTPYPDTEVPPSAVGQHCQGGSPDTALTATVLGGTGTVPCYYSDWGNEIAHNTFRHNGGYGNPTNGDIADISHTPPEDPTAPGNCWHDNTDVSGTLTQAPSTLAATNGTCGRPVYPDPAEEPMLVAEAACDSQLLFECAPPAGVPAQYPQTTTVKLKALPRGLASMPNPCAGVPANPWCPRPARRHAPAAAWSSGRQAGVPFGGMALLATTAAARRRRLRRAGTVARGVR